MATTRHRFGGRFAGGYGSPVRVISLGGTGSSTRITGIGNDTTARAVDQLGESLKRIQDTEALQKLAEGDPQTFLAYAKQRMDTLPEGHPDIAVWKDLIEQAGNKLEQEQWANDIKNKSKTLEDFGEYLVKKIGTETPGSPAAASLMKAINANKNAIQARDESKKDQDAQIAYINSGDHAAYKDYLTSKLARTTDATAQKTIMGQIDTLDERIKSGEAAGRAQKINDVVTAYRSGDWTAAQAVQALHDLVQTSKGISPAEINTVDSAVNSIFNLEQSKANAASAGSKTAGENQSKTDVENARITFQQAIAAINDKASHPDAGRITNKELTDLHSARVAYENALTVAMNNTTNPNLYKTWGDAAAAIPGATIAAEQTIDKAALNGVDPNLPVSDFTKGMTDPTGKFDALGQRQATLASALHQTITSQGRTAVQKALTETLAARQGAIAELATTRVAGTDPNFSRALANYTKDAKDDTVVTGVKLDQAGFEGALERANNPDELNALLGYAQGSGFSDGVFRAAKFGLQQQKGGIISRDNVGQAAQLAFKMATDPTTPDGTLTQEVATLAAQAAHRQGSLASGSEGPLTTAGEQGPLEASNTPADLVSQLPPWLGQKILSKGPQPKQPDLGQINTEPMQNTQPMGSQPAFDPGTMDQTQFQQQQEPDQLDQAPTWRDDAEPTTNANNMLDWAQQNLEQDTTLDLPGFTIPDLPDVSPFTFGDPFNWMTYNTYDTSGDPYAAGGPFDTQTPGGSPATTGDTTGPELTA